MRNTKFDVLIIFSDNIYRCYNIIIIYFDTYSFQELSSTNYNFCKKLKKTVLSTKYISHLHSSSNSILEICIERIILLEYR